MTVIATSARGIQGPRKFRERPINCEALCIRQDADFFTLMFASPIVPNEMVNGAMVVTIHGPMDHHSTYGCESYEGIAARFKEALDSEAPAVILRIDSPGGVVSGLNELVYSMRRMKEESGKPVYVYVGEMACSAAYAIACAGDEICIPPSGVAGSIGVISLMYDQVQADKEAGLNFVTITSGARKADGHPHVGVTDEAIEAETSRVDELAGQFFQLVSEARPITPDEAQGLEAGIFLGAEAVEKGVADEVLGWDGVLEAVAALHGSGPPTAIAKKPVAQSDTNEAHYGSEAHMKLAAQLATCIESIKKTTKLISDTKAKIVSEDDKKKRQALSASLAKYEAELSALKKTKIKYEEKTEETSEEEEAAAAEEEESGGNETDRNEGDPPADDDDEEDPEEKKSAAKKAAKAAKKGEEEEASASEEEAEALALLRQFAEKKGGRVSAVLANVLADRAESAALSERLAKIERRNETTDKGAKIAKALDARRITKAEAETLRAKPLAFVSEYLEMRKSAIVRTPSETLQPGAELPTDIDNGYPDQGHMSAVFSKEEQAEQERMIQDIIARSGGKVTREQIMKDFNTRLGAMNGGPKGRF